MSSHVFHEIFLHLNWHAKDSQPLITATLEPKVYELLDDRCRKIGRVFLHGIGGMPTHVHMAINIEPQVCISDFVGELKGASHSKLSQKSRVNSPKRRRSRLISHSDKYNYGGRD